MKNNKYWLKRFEQLQKAQMSKGIGFDRELSEEYEKAIAAVSKEIAYWYERFADNNGISMAAAKRMLNGRELKELRWDVDTYMKNALNAGEKYAKQLENASAKVHIDRLTALKLEMQITANQLAEKTAEGLKATLEDIYRDGYFKTAYEIQKGTGIGFAFGGLDKAKIENAVLKPWAKDGKNFSQRVWGDQRAKLVNSLETHLTQAVIRGDSPEKLIKQLTDDFKVARSRASTLVMTESAFFASESSKKSMENLGVEKYEIIGTLDSTACGECGSLDGKVYAMAECEIGRTAPPFHPNCRCTTAPYIEDEEGMTRIARDKDGKTYDVPADMTYKEWKEKFVDEDEYPRFLENKSSKIIDIANGMKYNISPAKEKELVQGYRTAIGKGDISPFITFEQYKQVAERIENELIGLKTVAGYEVKGYVTHFIDRVIGQVVEPHKNMRMGVPIEDVKEALLHGEADKAKFNKGKPSQVIKSAKCKVALNPNTKCLIQVSPKGRKR